MSLGLFCLSGVGAAWSEDTFPSKPVKIVVPFGVGGGSDTFVRVLQLGLERGKFLPESAVVLNVPGAGGTIGSYRVKNARPDGYVILNLHDGIFTARHAGKCLYGPEAFEPIAATGQVPSVIAVAATSPYQTLKDLLEAAAREPDTITMGANLGAPSHLTGLELQALVEGAAFRYVPTGGGSSRSKALVGGHLEASAFSLSEILQEEGGGLRTLAILSAERHPSLPDIPTAIEQGYALERSTTQYWWAPKGTPPERIAYLADMLKQAIAQPDAAERLRALQVSPFFLEGEELRTHVAREDERVRAMKMTEPVDVPDITPALAAVCALLGIGAFCSGGLRPALGENRAAHPLRPLVLGGLLTAYVVGLTVLRLPFAYSTPVFVLLAGSLLGPRNLRGTLLLAGLGLLLGFGLHWLFTEILVIDLP